MMHSRVIAPNRSKRQFDTRKGVDQNVLESLLKLDQIIVSRNISGKITKNIPYFLSRNSLKLARGPQMMLFTLLLRAVLRKNLVILLMELNFHKIQRKILKSLLKKIGKKVFFRGHYFVYCEFSKKN